MGGAPRSALRSDLKKSDHGCRHHPARPVVVHRLSRGIIARALILGVGFAWHVDRPVTHHEGRWRKDDTWSPDKADFLAQSNQLGSGDAARRANDTTETATDSTVQQVASDPTPQEERVARHVDDLVRPRRTGTDRPPMPSRRLTPSDQSPDGPQPGAVQRASIPKPTASGRACAV
jgi:hypothetical protein